jgi:hypothetical protein
MKQKPRVSPLLLPPTAKATATASRVLTVIVDEPRRPAVITLSDRTLFSKDSSTRFGIKACRREMDRRRVIYDLMTDDERKLFAQYCTLRDEWWRTK